MIVAITSLNVGYAQEDTVAKSLIKGVNDMKSGNALDVLTNFFQFAVRDLTGDDKAFDFNSTLFAIKLRGDSTLNIDSNFIKQCFARNLQFGVSLNFKKDFKFAGFAAEVTYAIVNNRDKALANFVGQAIEKNNNTFQELIHKLSNDFEAEISILPKKTKDSLRREMAKGTADFASTGSTEGFPQMFKDMAAREGQGELTKLGALHGAILKDYDSLMEDISHKGLLTVSVNGKTSRTNGFDEAKLEMVYLKGKNVQADVRGNLYFKDTGTISSDYRLGVNFTGGADIAILRAKGHKKSLIEIKPALEYSNIFNGVLPGEEKEMFSFNTEIRVRVIDQIWIPLILKYDIKNQNFLGFLNVSVNLDAFKNFIKS